MSDVYLGVQPEETCNYNYYNYNADYVEIFIVYSDRGVREFNMKARTLQAEGRKVRSIL